MNSVVTGALFTKNDSSNPSISNNERQRQVLGKPPHAYNSTSKPRRQQHKRLSSIESEGVSVASRVQIHAPSWGAWLPLALGDNRSMCEDLVQWLTKTLAWTSASDTLQTTTTHNYSNEPYDVLL